MYNLARLEISFYLVAQLVIHKLADSDFSRQHTHGQPPCSTPLSRVRGPQTVLLTCRGFAALSFLLSQTLELFFLWKSSALWSQQLEGLKDGEINRLLGSEHLVGHGGYSVGVLKMGIFIFLPLLRPSFLLLSSTAGVGLRCATSLSRVQQKQMMALTKVKDLPGCSQGRASSGVRHPKLQPPCN